MPNSKLLDNSTLVSPYNAYVKTPLKETELDKTNNKDVEKASERTLEKSSEESPLMMFMKTQSSNKNVKKAMQISVKHSEKSLDDRVRTIMESSYKDYSKIKGHDSKAFKCSQLDCGIEETKGPVCASNQKTGYTVSFKNECDVKKHNCRFNTDFKTILHDICPWQFESISRPNVSEELQHHN
ncbi:hypothetical protein O0L34_g3206 [Tuta absoluta]|nr:hypothetical protein O0L34_g3206 [Tuta absoluta]